MRNTLWLLVALLYSVAIPAQAVAISTTGNPADASAALDVSSNIKGFLPPRMSMQQRDAINSGNPTPGLTVFCSNCVPAGVCTYTGTGWATQSAKVYKIGDAVQQANCQYRSTTFMYRACPPA